MAEKTKSQGLKKTLAGVNLGDKTASVRKKFSKELLIEGSTMKEWWAQQAGNVLNKFLRVIRQGVANGESPQLMAARVTGGVVAGEPVKGFINTSRTQANTLTFQAVTQTQNATRIESFRKNSDVLKGMQQVSTFDDRTTDICMAYANEKWDLDGNPIEGSTLPFNGGPPRHWRCRSTLIPITKSLKDLGFRGNRKSLNNLSRATIEGQAAIGTTFDAWLKQRSVEFQDRMLGRRKGILFRKGELKLKDLVNKRGDPLTTDQLLRKIARRQ